MEHIIRPHVPLGSKNSYQGSFNILILVMVVVIILIPIVILVFGSLKTTGEMYSHPYAIPNPPHWENLLTILTSARFWRLL